ncbi:MAG: hypothetical protein MRJ65_14440 [Candidatus Brocadiaceae bacterium]|nr:hypothetical protein [Candidatus Brocadiaceae bacterium]
MDNLYFPDIPIETQKVVEPFFQDILSKDKENIISLYLTGSAVTKDFDKKYSDINSTVVVKEVTITFFDFIATLGKRYGKKKVHAPLIITQHYVNRSLDVFPLEFLEMKLIHQLVYGIDVLKDIDIKKEDVRLQCERELKGKLQQLCQGYIRAMGDKTLLTDLLRGLLSGYFPIFRGILFLHDQNIPGEKNAVVSAIQKDCNADLAVFTKALHIRTNNLRPTVDELRHIFEGLYRELDSLAQMFDQFEIKHG